MADRGRIAWPGRTRDSDDDKQNRKHQQHPQAHERKRLCEWCADFHADEAGTPEHDEQSGCDRDEGRLKW